LDAISNSKKTKKGGYLKDGFVVDSDEEETSYSSENEYETDSQDQPENMEQEEVIDIMENIGYELTEEPYEYSEDEDDDDDDDETNNVIEELQTLKL
jgi:hypothetical protein